MIKKLFHGLVQVARPPVPYWLTSWYWLDRLQDRRDRIGPRRSVSRFKVVRVAKGMFHSLGLVGWIWAALATAGLLWLTKGAGFTIYLVTVGTALASLKAGAIWTRRNQVMRIEWEDGCPRCDAEEDL